MNFPDRDFYPSQAAGPAPSLQNNQPMRNAEAALTEMAAVRSKMSVEELGTLAGVSVADRYRTAKAETTVRWWKDPALALSSCYGLLTVGAPALALGAGVALDVAIFGGAAHDLMKINPLYSAMAVGSLVFAIGIGIAKNHKKTLTGFMMTATLGASILAADNPDFKHHFASMLPSSLNSRSDAAAVNDKSKQNDVEFWKAQLKNDQDQLNTGGIGGKPMLADGSPGNDDQGRQLQNITIPNDKDKLQQAMNASAESNAQKNVADRENTAEFLGRLLGALYMATWLAASQLVVANVVDRAPKILKRQREKSAAYREQKQVVDSYEDPDREKAKGIIAADVSGALMSFSRILTNAAVNDNRKRENVEQNFDGDSLEKMKKTGVDLVLAAITPRRVLWPWKARSESKPTPVPHA